MRLHKRKGKGKVGNVRVRNALTSFNLLLHMFYKKKTQRAKLTSRLVMDQGNDTETSQLGSIEHSLTLKLVEIWRDLLSRERSKKISLMSLIGIKDLVEQPTTTTHSDDNILNGLASSLLRLLLGQRELHSDELLDSEFASRSGLEGGGATDGIPDHVVGEGIAELDGVVVIVITSQDSLESNVRVLREAGGL